MSSFFETGKLSIPLPNFDWVLYSLKKLKVWRMVSLFLYIKANDPFERIKQL